MVEMLSHNVDAFFFSAHDKSSSASNRGGALMKHVNIHMVLWGIILAKPTCLHPWFLDTDFCHVLLMSQPAVYQCTLLV